MLKEKYYSHFIHTQQESDQWLAKWKLNHLTEIPWDFSSWIAAIKESEVELLSIEINDDGKGRIVFEQLCHPTGGIDALAEVVRIYGANNKELRMEKEILKKASALLLKGTK